MVKDEVTLDSVREYWKGKNVPQQWYSNKEPFSLQWYNEIRYKRYDEFYEYLKYDAEFDAHEGERVLEVGCGLGTDLAEFAKHGAIVDGVDLGEDQVKLTTLNLNLRKLPFNNIQTGNAESLPFEDNTFDVVYSFGVLHHTPNTQKAIDEVFRVLKPDGQAIIMLYARGWKHYLKRCLIHGILRGKIFKYNFNWQKVYDDVSEVNGGAPKSGVYTRSQAKEFFKEFEEVDVSKKRMGEFFEYAPYRTVKLPSFINKMFMFFGLEGLLGENWLIKAYKSPVKSKDSLWNVIYKHY